MIKSRHVAKDVAHRIDEAVDYAMEAYRDERVSGEDDITARILGGIEQSIQGFTTRRITWSSSSPTSKGRGSEEKILGADFVGSLRISLPEYSVEKGFLCQAKKAEPKHPFSKTEWERLISQCEVMLTITNSAFVIIYSKDRGARFVSANAIIGLKTRDPFDLYDQSVSHFFLQHLISFVGDRNLGFSNAKQLAARASELKVNRSLFIQGVSESYKTRPQIFES